MKFNVDGKIFQQRLQAASKVITGKNALSILDNFLLSTVGGDRLSITGSDSENVLTVYVPVTDLEGEGAIAIPAKRLLEITKEISNQPLTFYINDDTKEVDLRFLNGHFNFMGVPADEYPRLAQSTEERVEFTVPADMVKKGLDNTCFAVSVDTVRPIMTGIYWDIHEEDITFVSSDTHKLVRYVNRAKAPGLDAHFVMPSKVANIIRSLITSEDVDIRISFDSKSGLFEFGEYFISCLFIHGNYPDYRRVIPENNPFNLEVDRETLMGALRRVNLFSSKSSKLVVLNIQPNEVIISAQDYDYSTSAEERVTCSYEGNVMTIGFNGQYMVEILGNLKEDSIRLLLSDPARPGLYTPAEKNDGEDIVIVQMPMQVI